MHVCIVCHMCVHAVMCELFYGCLLANFVCSCQSEDILTALLVASTLVMHTRVPARCVYVLVKTC